MRLVVEGCALGVAGRFGQSEQFKNGRRLFAREPGALRHGGMADVVCVELDPQRCRNLPHVRSTGQCDTTPEGPRAQAWTRCQGGSRRIFYVAYGVIEGSIRRSNRE